MFIQLHSWCMKQEMAKFFRNHQYYFFFETKAKAQGKVQQITVHFQIIWLELFHSMSVIHNKQESNIIGYNLLIKESELSLSEMIFHTKLQKFLSMQHMSDQFARGCDHNVELKVKSWDIWHYNSTLVWVNKCNRASFWISCTSTRG